MFNSYTDESVRMTFEAALTAIKDGHALTRVSWGIGGTIDAPIANGRLFMITPSVATEAETYPHCHYHSVGAVISPKPFVASITINGDLTPWVPSQADLFATDWVIVNIN